MSNNFINISSIDLDENKENIPPSISSKRYQVLKNFVNKNQSNKIKTNQNNLDDELEINFKDEKEPFML